LYKPHLKTELIQLFEKCTKNGFLLVLYGFTPSMEKSFASSSHHFVDKKSVFDVATTFNATYLNQLDSKLHPDFRLVIVLSPDDVCPVHDSLIQNSVTYNDDFGLVLETSFDLIKTHIKSSTPTNLSSVSFASSSFDDSLFITSFVTGPYFMGYPMDSL
jgi:hypothetical protein